ncbi:hypothetical protein MMC07_005439 [Pseudocyphellaria aurata]|nr:hypothetical protein [Pseudocyphellaria aurata]
MTCTSVSGLARGFLSKAPPRSSNSISRISDGESAASAPAPAPSAAPAEQGRGLMLMPPPMLVSIQGVGTGVFGGSGRLLGQLPDETDVAQDMGVGRDYSWAAATAGSAAG